MAQFSDSVCIDDKRLMVEALHSKRRQVNSKDVDSFQTKSLSDFVTKRSINLFYKLQLSQDILVSDPET